MTEVTGKPYASTGKNRSRREFDLTERIVY